MTRVCRIALVCFVALLGTASAAFAQTGEAGLRLAPLVPDAPLVDLVVDGKLMLKDLGFGQVSGYLVLAAGKHELKVFPHRAPNRATPEGAAGTTTPTGEAERPRSRVAPIEPIVITVTLEADSYSTVVLSGFFDPPPPQDQLGSLVVTMKEGTEVTVSGPRGFVVNLDRELPLVALEPGTYTVVATRPGFQSAQYEAEVRSGTTTTLPITLQAGDDAATPSVQPATAAVETTEPVWHKAQLQLYKDPLALPAAGRAVVRLIHASPTTQPIDLLLGSVGTEPSQLFAELEFPNSSSYQPVPSGPLRLQLRISGTDFILAELPALSLGSGGVYTLYLVGNIRDGYATLIPGVDALVTGGAR